MTRAKKLDSEYYQAVKDILQEITGLPKSVWEEISSQGGRGCGKEYFRADAVTLFLGGPKKYKVNWKPFENAFDRRPQAVTKQYLEFLKTFPKSPELRKKFPNAEITMKNCGWRGVENHRWVPVDSLIIIIPQKDIEAVSNVNVKPDHDTISFWATSVFDLRNEAVAYGARITSVDGWKFPDKGDIGRIQQSIGERRFYEFSKGGTRSFRTYNELVKYLKSIDSYINVPSEQQIIDSGYDERYYTY